MLITCQIEYKPLALHLEALLAGELYILFFFFFCINYYYCYFLIYIYINATMNTYFVVLFDYFYANYLHHLQRWFIVLGKGISVPGTPMVFGHFMAEKCTVFGKIGENSCLEDAHSWIGWVLRAWTTGRGWVNNNRKTGPLRYKIRWPLLEFFMNTIINIY